MGSTILLIDDEINNLESTANLLEEDGFECVKAASGEEGLKKAGEERVDLVLCDLMMPSMSGARVFQELQKKGITVPFIAITAHASVDSAVNLMKMGAFDYISKPLNFDELKIVIQRAMEKQRLTREVDSLRGELEKKFNFHNIIGKSGPIRNIWRLIESVASNDCTVLIQGETGTGKELAARAIHYSGQRRDKPFVTVNCAAFPESLLESELFGHEKGAFTGAVARRIGNFETAQGGTIFLDEIGCANPSTQAKLLRVIETKEFARVGGNQKINVDTRIISATNMDLKKASERGNFRSDLYFRLNVVPIHLPPLRERREDIPLLAESFLKKYAGKYQKNCNALDPKILDLLYRYPWPGNIRELNNFIERLVVTCTDGRGRIDPGLVLGLLPSSEEGTGEKALLPSADLTLDKAEREWIAAALKKSAGNRGKTAELLGITRKVLWLKMKKHRLLTKGETENPTEFDELA